MPLVVDGQRLVLKCINHEQVTHLATGAQTTMTQPGGWHALMAVEPPTSKSNGPNFVMGSGLPVRAFVCSVCGYVESYAAGITEPNLWWGAQR